MQQSAEQLCTMRGTKISAPKICTPRGPDLLELAMLLSNPDLKASNSAFRAWTKQV
jgi:hypothetical protein